MQRRECEVKWGFQGHVTPAETAESFIHSFAEATYSCCWWAAPVTASVSLLSITPRLIGPDLESTQAGERSWLSQTNQLNRCLVMTLMLDTTWGRMGDRRPEHFYTKCRILIQLYSFPLRILFYKECDALRSREAQKLKLLFLKHFNFATKILQINNKLNQPTINTAQSTADKRVCVHLTRINPGERKTEQ